MREPGLQVIDDRPGPYLPEPHPLVGWLAAVVLLDGVEPGDALDGVLGNDRAISLEDVAELAPDVGHAGNLAHIETDPDRLEQIRQANQRLGQRIAVIRPSDYSMSDAVATIAGALRPPTLEAT